MLVFGAGSWVNYCGNLRYVIPCCANACGVPDPMSYEYYSVIVATISAVIALTAIAVSIWSIRHAAQLAYGFDEVGRTRWAKISCLRRLMANRHAITRLGTTESREIFFAALNEVPVTFYHDEEVMVAWREISLAIKFDGHHNIDHILNVIRAAANAVGQPISAGDDRYLGSPFGLNPEAVSAES